jgi:hypothetical protein
MSDPTQDAACVADPATLAEMAAADPDGPVARADRLVAAELDTGVTLGQRVTVKGTHHGVMSVVGFARVNVPGIDEPVRCVCVADPEALRLHGVETVMTFTPDRILPTPTAK